MHGQQPADANAEHCSASILAKLIDGSRLQLSRSQHKLTVY